MNKGQITFTTVVGWGIGIVTLMAGSFVAQNRITENKIELIKSENSIEVQRIAVLEEAIKTIKLDNAEIKADIKLILRRVK